MPTKVKTFLNYFLLIFWMGLIFYLSAQPDLKSSYSSEVDFILRKIAHMTEYAILAFLAWRAASGGGEKKSVKYLVVAIVFSVFYAISDEYRQTFTAGREGSARDASIDSIGIALAAAMIWKKLIL